MMVDTGLQQIALYKFFPPRVKVNQFRDDLTDSVKPVVFVITELTLVFKAHEADVHHTTIAQTGDDDGLINGARAGIVILMVTTVLEITGDEARKTVAVIPRRIQRDLKKRILAVWALLSTRQLESRRLLLGFCDRAALAGGPGDRATPGKGHGTCASMAANTCWKNRLANMRNDVGKICIPTLKGVCIHGF